MSDIIEKTLASLPSLITGGLNPVSRTIGTSGFSSFVDNLSKCRTSFELNEFLCREVENLKLKLAKKDLSLNQTKDGLVRAIFCYLMGHDITFAQIHAVKMAQQGCLSQKRVGYLASYLFLTEKDEMVIMLVNTIQKDLQSSNIIEINAGLTAAGKLISQELIPAILPLVEMRLNHPKASVRKKAVMCLNSFYSKAPSLLEHSGDSFKKALCDKDPGVMWAALQTYQDMIESNPSEHSDIGKSLIHILTQVISRHFPSEFDYSNIPAPWLQIQLLQILAKLGESNEQIRSAMCPVLSEVFQRIDPMQRMGLAVIYECVKTVACIKADSELLEKSSQCVSKFLSARNVNLKYLGIKSLSLLVKISPAYAIPHQEIVIECLAHSDVALRCKVLELLYCMCNESNVQVVCRKLMENIQTTTDLFIRSDLVSKILQLSQKFCMDITWYTQTVNSLIEKASQHITQEELDKIMKTIKCHLNSQPELCNKILHVYWQYMKRDEKTPDQILQISAWIIGEYQHSVSSLSASEALTQLEIVYTQKSVSSTCQHIILTSMTKVIGWSGANGINLDGLRLASSWTDPQLRNRINEIACLTKNTAFLQKVVSMDLNLTNVDSTLSFLDGFVGDMLEKGAKPYQPRSLRVASPHKKSGSNSIFSELNMKAYQSPQHTSKGGFIKSSKQGSIHSGGSNRSGSLETSEPILKMDGVKRIWGKTGINKDLESPSQSPSSIDRSQTSKSLSESNDSQLDRHELVDALFGGL